MKMFAAVAVAMLSSIPTFAQNHASCKAFFQVLQADAGMPGLHTGLNRKQKSWWDNKGQRRYPDLCLDGSIMSGDKPRFLVIWSNSKSIGEGSLAPNEVYGQTANALRATAPTVKIYQRTYNWTSVTVVNVQYDGTLLLPAVYYLKDNFPYEVVRPGSVKVLDSALRYLSQERVFLANPH
jgi:hypothetical protein